MNRQPPISESLWSTFPVGAQAALLDARKSLRDRIAQLEAQVRDLAGPAPTQLHQLLQAAVLRPYRPETKGSQSDRSEALAALNRPRPGEQALPLPNRGPGGFDLPAGARPTRAGNPD